MVLECYLEDPCIPISIYLPLSSLVSFVEVVAEARPVVGQQGVRIFRFSREVWRVAAEVVAEDGPGRIETLVQDLDGWDPCRMIRFHRMHRIAKHLDREIAR